MNGRTVCVSEYNQDEKKFKSYLKRKKKLDVSLNENIFNLHSIGKL